MIKKEFYKDFKPELSPKKMLELGVFGGSYFSDGSIKEFPKEVWIGAYSVRIVKKIQSAISTIQNATIWIGIYYIYWYILST